MMLLFLKSFSFHKKNVFDLEKTKAKILDPKKDSVSRMRYMKLLSGTDFVNLFVSALKFIFKFQTNVPSMK